MIEIMLYDTTACDEKLCPQGRCPVTHAVVKCAGASALAAVNDLRHSPGAALNLSLPGANQINAFFISQVNHEQQQIAEISF